MNSIYNNKNNIFNNSKDNFDINRNKIFSNMGNITFNSIFEKRINNFINKNLCLL